MATSTHVRVRCPHCDAELRVGLALEAVELTKRGPDAWDPGPEIDAYVIEKIEDKNCSFHTLAALLEDRGVLTAKGGKKWYAASARRVYLSALQRRVAREQ